MTQYNTLTVKLSNSQLNKLKSWIKLGTEVTLNLSSNLMGNSNNAANFPHKFQGFLKCLQMVLQLIKKSEGFIWDIPIFENILQRVAKKETDIARSLGKDFLYEQIGSL